MADDSGAHSEADIIRTNVGVISGMRAPESFSRGAGVREYASWVAALSDINAKGVAQVPLRLYARRRSGRKMLQENREVPKRRKAYLLGDARRNPGTRAMQKFVEYGSDFVEITNHRAIDLLHSVNAWMCGFELMNQTEMFQQLDGNAYWFKVMGPLGVMDLWPLPPQHVYVIPDVGRYIKGYEYRPKGSGGASIRFDADEVIHFRMPNPVSQFYGMGNVQRAWMATLANRARHEMDVAFYDNYGRPDIVWILKNTSATAQQIDEFTATMEQKLKGRRKHGRHVAVTGDVDLKNLQWSPKEMATEETTVEELCAIWGVPVSMAMANDPNLASATVGYALWREQTIAPRCCMTADVLNQNLLPDFGIENDAVFVYDDPVPENQQQESEVRARYVQFGIKTPNEVREEMGDDPSPDPMADTLLYNGQPLGSTPTLPALSGPVDSTPDEQPAKPQQGASAAATVASDPGASVQDTALNGAQVSALVDIVNQVRQGVVPVDSGEAIAQAAFPLMTPEQLSGIFNPLRSAKPLERPAEPSQQPPASTSSDAAETPPTPPKPTEKAHMSDVNKCCVRSGSKILQSAMITKGDSADTVRDDENEKVMRDFIKSLEAIGTKQAKAIVDRISRVGTDPRAAAAAAQLEISRAQWTKDIANAARPYISRQVKAGGVAGSAMLAGDFTFDFEDPRVSKYVDKTTTRMAVSIQDTTAERVRGIMAEGMAAGDTVDELSDRVLESGETIDGARAETIARTESARSYVVGRMEAWKQSGVVSHKKWLLAPDACEFCRAASREFNANPVPIDEPFYKQGETITGVSGGTMQLDYDDVDGPPLHPNDRCDVIPVID